MCVTPGAVTSIASIAGRSLRALMTGLPGRPLRLNRASYDLARLHRNGLITRRPNPSTCDLTPDCLKSAIFCTQDPQPRPHPAVRRRPAPPPPPAPRPAPAPRRPPHNRAAHRQPAGSREAAKGSLRNPAQLSKSPPQKIARREFGDQHPQEDRALSKIGRRARERPAGRRPSRRAAPGAARRPPHEAAAGRRGQCSAPESPRTCG
jgi:hypothetical protein